MAAQADEYRAKAAECARQAQQASNSTMKFEIIVATPNRAPRWGEKGNAVSSL
jgi:hypothetical protein